MERGGWNGPRKHGEGGNTSVERGLPSCEPEKGVAGG